MITSRIISNGLLRAMTTIVIVCLILYFLYQIQSVLIYILVSVILTLIGAPILHFLKRRLKFNHTFAAITTLLLYIFIFLGFIMMFIPLITAQGQNLSLLDTAKIEQSSLELVNQIKVFLDGHHIDSNQLLNEANITSKINFKSIPNFLNSILGTVGSFGMGLASVLFITFFFLKDKNTFIKGSKLLIPDGHEEKVLNSVKKINVLLSRYFIGLLLQLFVVFILYTIVLFIFGVPNVLVIAFLCAVLNIIPYIGPLIASVLAAILTMLSNISGDFQSEVLPTTIYVLIGFWVVQVIDNNLSQPIIFSKSVSSHPLEIFLVILIAGFMSGIVGMIVAVPLYTIIKVICKEFFPENKLIQLITKNI